ncbi:hypothetical protein BDU57DRAFT_68855 [Ampelomyces quisqualis]|uniref:Uncharacterized protein n=1 Tax=Ampelomyces quisqualis TaxID=50730 RepID=A0A6A5R5H4_AMPQU|nr:hypothetical protein BDU57DRAFT_68855 [Ampelomyces quisqualis]
MFALLRPEQSMTRFHHFTMPFAKAPIHSRAAQTLHANNHNEHNNTSISSLDFLRSTANPNCRYTSQVAHAYSNTNKTMIAQWSPVHSFLETSNVRTALTTLCRPRPDGWSSLSPPPSPSPPCANVYRYLGNSCGDSLTPCG